MLFRKSGRLIIGTTIAIIVVGIVAYVRGADRIQKHDTRLLITPENSSEIFITPPESTGDPSIIGEEYNFDPPTTTVQYRNDDVGIRLEIPYNPAWGSDKYRVAPYNYYDTPDAQRLNFGPIGIFEGGSLFRQENLFVRPYQTAAQIVARLQQERIKQKDISGLPITPEPKIVQLNNLTAVEYVELGFCETASIEIVGKKYNYELRLACSQGFANWQDMAYLERIAKTIELVP